MPGGNQLVVRFGLVPANIWFTLKLSSGVAPAQSKAQSVRPDAHLSVERAELKLISP